MFKNSFWLTVLFTVFCPITCASTAYPQSTVRIIVPWATGGSTDLLARLLADNLRLQYSQNFVVDNRSGASGNIGSEIVAKAKPDGHTLLLGVMSTHVVNPIIMNQMPFDGVDDFSPIALAHQRQIVLFFMF
jgi:tripartite-type tricarboxylate transporter receptor subunit TctC